ncbi:hypothetical protein ACOSQ2_023833 [Xanthoceras sorbifolium]
MLQRAASNAYSWWWASHIRTKQSKWMEQNLQDMEEKVGITLKLIQEDGDSFAKRAEMYYKRRPELINFVEESYRAYRALAERYDHISSELQNANNTIASVFPDQVQFSMDDDDDDSSPRMQRGPPEIPKTNVPKVPNMPTKEFKRTLTSSKKKLLPSKSTKKTFAVAKSGLSKPEGLKKIDKLQKQILGLQTEKEFVKSSYESRLAKYWEIENQIKEVQENVCSLEDEFGEGMVIEDDEARTLMAAAAINSCQETLAQLEEKQERSAEQAKAEEKRIEDARNKLVSFKDEFVGNETSQKMSDEKVDSEKAVEDVGRLDQDVESATLKREELGTSGQSIKEHFEDGSNASLTVTEMAEKIDELVVKVVSLETAVSSQTSLLQRLRTETDELQAQIQNLEDDKATLIDEKSELSIKLMEMEKKLQGLQELNLNVEDQNDNLQTSKARCNVDHLSDKLKSVKPDEEFEQSSKTEEKSLVQTELQKQSEEQVAVNPSDGLKKQHSVKLSEDLVTSSSEKEEKSPVQAVSQQQIEGQEDSANPGNGNLTEVSEKLHSEKPDEELKVSGATQKEAKSMVKVASIKDFKEQEEKLNKGDEPGIAMDVQTEEVKGVKEHDISATAGNQGEVVSQSQENGETGDLLEKRQVSSQPPPVLSVENHVVTTKQDDEPDWKQLFLNGMENREKVLLTEYTTVLRNYKELKKKLGEGDGKTEHSNSQMKELKSVNAKKDEEIRCLRQKLSFLQEGFDGSNNLDYQNLQTRSAEGEEDARVIEVDQHQNISPIEEKFRTNIDELLEENLDFWLRFSSSFHQIQKFETEVKDLQGEVSKVEEKKKNEGSGSSKYSLKSDMRPLYKHLTEIQTELAVWMEKSALLKDELKSRFSSLCNIQEDITMALKVSAEADDFKFTSYQAAKFQGEVLNMKQENNKVADELQAGLDHVTSLQIEVEKTLAMLSEEFDLSASKSSPNMGLQRSDSKSRVPLRSFIFGVKPKKQKTSFFSCMHPALQRKYNNRRSTPNG